MDMKRPLQRLRRKPYQLISNRNKVIILEIFHVKTQTVHGFSPMGIYF
jgi:hypothetical protein